LACLTVEGLSACAKAVLIYLGVRSDYRGMTCVGHRRMCQDLVRSKDFVTRGLAELEERGYVSKSQRNRHKHQADWRTLSASLILKSRIGNQDETSEISPVEQDQISKSSPDFGKSSPDHQGKTSQIDSNLPDSVFEPVEPMKEGRNEGTPPLATLATADVAPAGQEKEKPPKSGERDEHGQLLPTYKNFLAYPWVDAKDGQRCGTEHDVWDVAFLWEKLTRIFVTGTEIQEDVAYLTYTQGYQNLLESMPLILRDCPKTAGIVWKDFHFFAENFERSLRNAQAWKRKIDAQAGAKAAVIGKPVAKIDPMVVNKPLAGSPGEFTTTIMRKPRTREERRELLSWRKDPKKRWDYVAPFLSQDNCPECHGSGKPCQCIVTEEVLYDTTSVGKGFDIEED